MSLYVSFVKDTHLWLVMPYMEVGHHHGGSVAWVSLQRSCSQHRQHNAATDMVVQIVCAACMRGRRMVRHDTYLCCCGCLPLLLLQGGSIAHIMRYKYSDGLYPEPVIATIMKEVRAAKTPCVSGCVLCAGFFVDGLLAAHDQGIRAEASHA